MTVSISVAIVIFLGVIVLAVLGSGFDLWSERMRRQTQRERWKQPDDPKH